MPVRWAPPRSPYAKEGSLKFDTVSGFLTDRNDLSEPSKYLLEKRKEAIAEREYWIALQKEAAKDKDFDLAKFCKGEASEWMKWYRAACWLIPHVCDYPYPGDCPYRDFYEAPEELFPQLCMLENIASIK